MTDQNPAPSEPREPVDGEHGEPADEDEDDEDEDDEPAAGRDPLLVAVLASLALLLFFSGFVTVLYLRQGSARADEQRTDAARVAEIEAMRTRLEAAEQQSQWTLNPAAYQAIRDCVQQAEAQRKLDEEIQKLIPTALPTSWPAELPTPLPIGPEVRITAFPDGPALGSNLAACEEAAKYLK